MCNTLGKAISARAKTILLVGGKERPFSVPKRFNATYARLLHAYMIKKDCRLEKLCILEPDIVTPFASTGIIADALKHNTSVRYLQIGGVPGTRQGHLTPSAVDELARALFENSALQHLVMNGNTAIGDEGMPLLSYSLSHNTTLTDLNLSKCGIGLQDAVSLAAALASNRTLRRLVLYDNSIPDEGALAFYELLENKVNTTLKNINLTKNEISARGIVPFYQRLLRTASEEEESRVYLSDNPGSSDREVVDLSVRYQSAHRSIFVLRNVHFDATHAQVLYEAVSTGNTRLKDRIDLQQCTTNDDAMIWLARTIAHSNCAVTRLSLTRTAGYSTKASIELAQAIGNNNRLRTICAAECPEIFLSYTFGLAGVLHRNSSLCNVIVSNTDETRALREIATTTTKRNAHNQRWRAMTLVDRCYRSLVRANRRQSILQVYQAHVYKPIVDRHAKLPIGCSRPRQLSGAQSICSVCWLFK
jgi:hypothetical protein